MVEVVVLGPEACGKTLLIRRIREASSGAPEADETAEATLPTVGTEMTTVNVGGRELTLREVGTAMASKWDSYILESVGIIFLIDQSDLGSLASAWCLLSEVLAQPPQAKAKELIVAFNKLDTVENSMADIASNIIRLDDLRAFTGFNVRVVEGSCIDLSLARKCIHILSHMS